MAGTVFFSGCCTVPPFCFTWQCGVVVGCNHHYPRVNNNLDDHYNNNK